VTHLQEEGERGQGNWAADARDDRPRTGQVGIATFLQFSPSGRAPSHEARRAPVRSSLPASRRRPELEPEPRPLGQYQGRPAATAASVVYAAGTALVLAQGARLGLKLRPTPRGR